MSNALPNIFVSMPFDEIKNGEKKCALKDIDVERSKPEGLGKLLAPQLGD